MQLQPAFPPPRPSHFSVRNALRLEVALVPEERDDFPLVWRGSWLRFARTYLAAVSVTA